MFKVLKLEKKNHIATLTLDLPEKRNAQTPEMTAEFVAAVDQIKDDADVHVAVLTATGSVFCAGGDLHQLQAQLDWEADANRHEMGSFYRKWLSLLRLDIPTIAAIGGHAVGAGLGMTLSCDLRYAADTAKLGFTYINLGLMPGMGSTHLLPALVGESRAAELLLTGKMITAAEAETIGLVNKALPAGQLLSEVMAIAENIASKSPVSTRMLKRTLTRARLNQMESALDHEAIAQAVSFGSKEMRDGVAALIKK